MIANIHKYRSKDVLVVETNGGINPSNSNNNTFVPKKVLGKFMHISDQPIKQSSGESLIFFMGAGFCPFCASERWAIVRALDKFGSWQGLIETTSADHDEKYLNIPTIDFSRAKYRSEYVDFVGRETADRNFEPLQELNQKDYDIIDTFNPDQIIPFLLIDGQFMQVGSGYSPRLLEGMNHTKVKSEVENPVSPIGKAIRTEADNITALICKSIGGRADICNTDEIKIMTQKI
jgi:thiol-disulfide isomerase/thioredoxin